MLFQHVHPTPAEPEPIFFGMDLDDECEDCGATLADPGERSIGRCSECSHERSIVASLVSGLIDAGISVGPDVAQAL